MGKYFLVGVGDVSVYDCTTGDLIMASKTMLDNSITTSTSATEVRGGYANALQYIYYHDPKMELTLTDSQFNLAWIAASVGSTINTGKNIWTEETITLGAGGTGTVSQTPLMPPDNTIVYGWIVDANQNISKVTFTGKNFTLPGGTSGQVVSAKYYLNNGNVTSVAIPSSIMPKVVRVVIDAKLGTTSSGSSGIVGSLQVELPRVQLDGSSSISLKSNAEANTALKGMAVAYTDPALNKDIYATVTQVINGSNWFDNVYALASTVDPLALSGANSPYTLDLRAIPYNGSAFKPNYSDLTFLSSDASKVTVSASGILTKVAVGSAIITVSITAKPSVTTNIDVTVS